MSPLKGWFLASIEQLQEVSCCHLNTVPVFICLIETLVDTSPVVEEQTAVVHQLYCTHFECGSALRTS